MERKDGKWIFICGTCSTLESLRNDVARLEAENEKLKKVNNNLSSVLTQVGYVRTKQTKLESLFSYVDYLKKEGLENV